MIKALASATLLLMLAACGSAPVQPVAGDRKPSPAGPPPPPMPDIPLVCPADVKLCSDGRSVGRNPARECEFDACPGIAPQ